MKLKEERAPQAFLEDMPIHTLCFSSLDTFLRAVSMTSYCRQLFPCVVSSKWLQGDSYPALDASSIWPGLLRGGGGNGPTHLELISVPSFWLFCGWQLKPFLGDRGKWLGTQTCKGRITRLQHAQAMELSEILCTTTKMLTGHTQLMIKTKQLFLQNRIKGENTEKGILSHGEARFSSADLVISLKTRNQFLALSFLLFICFC